MKKMYFAIVSAALFALTACGGQANAATLDWNFTATNGVAFSADPLRTAEVEKVTGGVKVTSVKVGTDGLTTLQATAYVDSNGTVFSKFVTRAVATGLYLQVGTSNRYISAPAPANSYCFSPHSMLVYSAGSGGNADVGINDNCVIAQGIKALGHQ